MKRFGPWVQVETVGQRRRGDTALPHRIPSVPRVLLAAWLLSLATGSWIAGAIAETPARADSREWTPDSRASLADLYRAWRQEYERSGGDRAVTLRLGHARGMPSPRPLEAMPMAHGEVRLDLVGGTAWAWVEGAGNEALEVWLVDNRPGPGRSFLPEPGDRMVRLGRLVPRSAIGGGRARLSRELGPDFFRRFEPDLAVVTRSGETPVAGGLLWGGRDFFARLHTRARRAGLARQEHVPAVEALVWPGASRLLPLPSPAPTSLSPSASVLVERGLLSEEVAMGADLFFRATFGGNGRTCGTCHRVERNLVLDPRFIAGLPDDDPLFVAERPAEDGGVPGLEMPEMLRRFGLILENVDGFEDPTSKFVLRGVPHTLSMATSILAPEDDGRAAVERTGWSGDGAPVSGALRFFAVGAITQHLTRSLERVAGVDFRLPTDEELDALEAYLLAVGRVADTRISTLILSDPRAEAGRDVFLGAGKCFRCHVNAGAISGFGGNRNHETGIERRDHPARDRRGFPRDGGFGVEPRDLDGDGLADVFGDGTFNIPPVVEAADTAPFFHNDAVATLEEAVAFYAGDEFNASPGGEFVGGVELTEAEIDDTAAFLRVMNAALNLNLALQRTSAARALAGGGRPRGVFLTDDSAPPRGRVRATSDTLLALANLEALDAVEVLADRGLHPEVVAALSRAVAANEAAIETASARERRRRIDEAVAELEAARPLFGRGLGFLLGEGNLAF